MRTTAKMGLTSWDQPTDIWTYAQLAGNWQILDFHDHSPGRGVPIAAGGLAPGAVLANSIAAGVINNTHLVAALAQSSGVNQTGQTVKGVSINAGSGTRTNVAFGALNDAADQVSVVLPFNGLLEVVFQGIWQESVSNAARAAIFLDSGGGANQQVIANIGVVSAIAAATPTSATANVNRALTTWYGGLASDSTNTAYPGNFATGQAVGIGQGGFATIGVGSPIQVGYGGACHIFANAGTYTVSVQYKASSGTVTASQRKLWVRALSYA